MLSHSRQLEAFRFGTNENRNNKFSNINYQLYETQHWIPTLVHGRHYHMDPQLVPKIAKSHFFQDTPNSFQWATGIGLEPHQKIFRKKNPTNTVTRAVQNFGRNGPLLAGWLSNSKNFVVNLAQICDEQMLKISGRYLDSCLI